MVPDKNSHLSARECDVALRDIHHVNVPFLQRSQNILDLRPAVIESFPFTGFPFRPNLVRELWWSVKIRPGEIKHEWPRHDAHFDDTQTVVSANELRNIE